jgi:8-oxo-dGTP pyrophosphatase MutT (NUDIX family)
MEQRELLPDGPPGRGGLNREELARRLTARKPGIRRSPGPDGSTRGDRDLNPGMPVSPSLVPAAVLVPLVERPEGYTVLLTRRTDHLANHAGQVSFPGGRIEKSDNDPAQAALRETEEEIGLGRAHIDLIGRLDDYVTGTGFRVVPVVGLVRPPFALAPDPFEVAEAFEVPLAFILDPANHQRCSRTDKGRERHFYAMPYERHYIWGATAGILVNLYEVLAD